jgi:hypothetical protein
MIPRPLIVRVFDSQKGAGSARKPTGLYLFVTNVSLLQTRQVQWWMLYPAGFASGGPLVFSDEVAAAAT